MTNHPLLRPMNGDRALSETTDGLSEHSTNFSEEIIPTSANQRQKQWTTDAAGVPHFLCVLSKKNYLLFACDKFGSIDLYQLDNNQPRNLPRHLRQFELFPGNTASQTPQIIETFTVYTPFIVISARKWSSLIESIERILTHCRSCRSNWYEFNLLFWSSWLSARRNMFTEFSCSTIISRCWI